MPLDLDQLLLVNSQVRGEMAAREARLREREGELRASLDECEAALLELASQRAALDTAEQIYRGHFNSASGQRALSVSGPSQSATAIPAKDDQSGQLRARIGPQRYLMFESMDVFGSLSIEKMGQITKLSAKRIKDQMNSDVANGFVVEAEGDYSLTVRGRELFEKFVNYKKSRGEQLPTAETVPPSSDDDDAAAASASREAETAEFIQAEAA